MKRRLGHVSNSSSSSFVCEVCGEADGGYDCCLSDVGMVECVNGHVFCKSHITKSFEDFSLDEQKQVIIERNYNKYAKAKELYPNKDYWKISEEERQTAIEKAKEDIANKSEEYFEEQIEGLVNEGFDSYEYPAELCPICNLDHIDSSRVLAYILQDSSTTVEQIEDEMRTKFKDLKELKEFL